ncbi:MAG: DUF2971 domain-containing protein [Myxococcales bacterium]
MAFRNAQQRLEIIEAFPSELQRAKAEQLHSTPPKYLYHYTDVRGLIGILEHGCLWATNSLYLNDSSESLYPLLVLDQAIDDCLKGTHNAAARRLLEPFKGQWVTTQFAFYVACFCEDGNLLNQWRVYAPNDGYSLRFNTGELLQGQEEARPRHHFSLIRVVYEEDEQRALLDELLGIVVKYAETHFPDDGDVDKSDKALRVYIHQPLLRLLLAFKHPAFKAEQEWRLVCGESGPWNGAKYRVGRYGLTPYIEYGRPLPSGTPRATLPISGVLHGPTANRDVAGHALHGLLQSFGYDGVEVGGSLLPIRG